MAHYLKEDSPVGYVEDSLQIQYLKFNNLRHTILGFMLGDFDEKGEYRVSAQIIKELIKMPKYLHQTEDNIEVCLSAIKLDKQITFIVTYEGDKVTLSLAEKLNYEANFKLNSGSYSNIHEFVLDEVETSGVVDRNVIYKRWNIKPFGGQVLDVFNMDEETLALYAGLVDRFKFLLCANKLLLDKEEEVEAIEEEYALNNFEVLSHYPELKTAVNNHIKETLNGKPDFIRVDRPNFAKTFNEVLDNAIESYLYLLTDEQKQQFNAERTNLLYNINLKRENLFNIYTFNGNYLLDISSMSLISLKDAAMNYLHAMQARQEKAETKNNKGELYNYLTEHGVKPENLGDEQKVEEKKEAASQQTNDNKKTEKKEEKSTQKQENKKPNLIRKASTNNKNGKAIGKKVGNQRTGNQKITPQSGKTNNARETNKGQKNTPYFVYSGTTMTNGGAPSTSTDGAGTGRRRITTQVNLDTMAVATGATSRRVKTASESVETETNSVETSNNNVL